MIKMDDATFDDVTGQRDKVILKKTDFHELIARANELAGTGVLVLDEQHDAVWFSDSVMNHGIPYFIQEGLPVPHLFVEGTMFMGEKQEITCGMCGTRITTAPKEAWKDYYKCPDCKAALGFPKVSYHKSRGERMKLTFDNLRVFIIHNVNGTVMRDFMNQVVERGGLIAGIHSYSPNERNKRWTMTVEIEKAFPRDKIEWSNPSLIVPC